MNGDGHRECGDTAERVADEEFLELYWVLVGDLKGLNGSVEESDDDHTDAPEHGNASVAQAVVLCSECNSEGEGRHPQEEKKVEGAGGGDGGDGRLHNI